MLTRDGTAYAEGVSLTTFDVNVVSLGVVFATDINAGKQSFVLLALD